MLPGVDCLATSIPVNPYLQVTKTLGKPCKQRKTFVLCALSHNHNYAVYNNNLTAIERAINERIFFVDYGDGFQPPLKPTQSFVDALAPMFKQLRKLVQYTTPLTAREFAGTYVGRRRTIYDKACDSLLIKPITKNDSIVSAFIKAEKYNFTKKPNPAPRIIQPRGPRYIVESGRYVKPIEKKIYKAIDSVYDSPTIFKGKNAEDRGAALRSHWDTFRKPVAIGIDAKRFDQHVSKEALEWEHSIYRLYYPDDKEFRRIMSWQLVNTGVARCNEGKAKYTVNGCRMSGDVNTALGNCLLMSSLIYCYAKHVGVFIRLANDGDDCVVTLESEDLAIFMAGLFEYAKTLGFHLTIEEPVYVFEQIEFCQCHPVLVGNQYIMVRDPRVAISKDCVALKPLDNQKIFKMWMAAVGEGGLSLTGGVPVWQHFYTRLYQLSDGAKPLQDLTMMTGMRMMSKGMSRKFTKPSPESRFSFWLAFGISPEEQITLEDYYDAYELGPSGQLRRFVPLPLEGQQY